MSLLQSRNDAQVHDKLDKLIEGLNETKDASAQLDRLDKIHQQVMSTAAEVSAFVTTQTRLIEEGHESKQKEVEEMALLLERRTAEKEHVECDIQSLSTEKENLLAVIESLQAERDALTNQKARLAADVSAMQTALAIRQEELDIMDAKADALERRVLEGIMDQSRLLMMTKGVNKGGNIQPGMRMASNASHSTLDQLPPPSVASKGLSMALNARPSPVRRNGGVANNPATRRVLSLNPISHNTPTGARGFNAANPTANSGFIKRSQSVRTNKIRKGSWNSAPDKHRSTSTHTLPEDKENEIISEVNSEDEDQGDDTISESGTERRLSHATEAESGAITSYASSVSEDTDRPSSRGTVTESHVSYDTEGGSSYMTGSEFSDRRTSYASTLRSTLGTGTTIDEEDEESPSGSEDEDTEGGAEEQTELEAGEEHDKAAQTDESAQADDGVARKDMVLYAAPSDSGLGTDLPTAALSGSETDYFRRVAEEAA